MALTSAGLLLLLALAILVAPPGVLYGMPLSAKSTGA